MQLNISFSDDDNLDNVIEVIKQLVTEAVLSHSSTKARLAASERTGFWERVKMKIG